MALLRKLRYCIGLLSACYTFGSDLPSLPRITLEDNFPEYPKVETLVTLENHREEMERYRRLLERYRESLERYRAELKVFDFNLEKQHRNRRIAKTDYERLHGRLVNEFAKLKGTKIFGEYFIIYYDQMERYTERMSRLRRAISRLSKTTF